MFNLVQLLSPLQSEFCCPLERVTCSLHLVWLMMDWIKSGFVPKVLDPAMMWHKDLHDHQGLALQGLKLKLKAIHELFVMFFKASSFLLMIYPPESFLESTLWLFFLNTSCFSGSGCFLLYEWFQSFQALLPLTFQVGKTPLSKKQYSGATQSPLNKDVTVY